jgi:hypothetical protein
MTTDVTTHAVESVKLAADLQPDTAEALRALFESASPLVTPASTARSTSTPWSG